MGRLGHHLDCLEGGEIVGVLGGGGAEGRKVRLEGEEGSPLVRGEEVVGVGEYESEDESDGIG